MFSVFENVFVLFFFVILGFTLCKTKIADNGMSQILSSLLVYVFLPAKILDSMSHDCTMKYISEKYILVIGGFIMLVLTMLVFYPISKKLAKTEHEKYVYWYSFVAPNFGYFGYPLAESLFGAEGLLNLIIFAIPTSFFCYTIGFCTLTKTKMSIKNLVTKPPLVATIAGAVAGLSGLGNHIPDTLNSILGMAGACMGPVAMILLGMVISEFNLSEFIKDKRVYILSVARLLIIPLIVTYIVSLFGIKELTLSTLMLCALPFGLNTVVYTKLVGEDCRLGAGFTTISTLLSCITIPIMVNIFN